MPQPISDQSRVRGRRTRGRLVDTATALFVERGLRGVSVSDIAAAAGAFPNQVTHHFGSKEALFVEVSIRSLTEALLIVRRRPELSKIVEYGLNVLFRRSESFLGRIVAAREWELD